jgi:predicted nucleotide-binding protein
MDTAPDELDRRPRIFVGSSTEGLKIAEALQFLLDDECDVDIWNRRVFELTQGTFETLVLKAPESPHV